MDFQGRATVVFDLGRLEAIVRGGDLITLSHGHCRATGSIELEGNLLARRLVPLPVDIALDFPRPVSLVRREDASTAELAGP